MSDFLVNITGMIDRFLFSVGFFFDNNFCCLEIYGENRMGLAVGSLSVLDLSYPILHKV